jgi:hypothetical protein
MCCFFYGSCPCWIFTVSSVCILNLIGWQQAEVQFSLFSFFRVVGEIFFLKKMNMYKYIYVSQLEKSEVIYWLCI